MDSSETRIYFTVLSGLFVLVVLISFFVITIVRYQRRKVSDNREKIKEQFICIDKERERTAFDLHDDLGASLCAIKLRLQRLKNLDADNELIISDSEQRIDDAMIKLRDIAFNMMPDVLQRQGLNAAIEELIGLMTYPTDIIVNYNNSIESVKKENAIHIYRIVQEITTNIIKHSNATIIDFRMSKNKKTIELRIQDNGDGFNKDLVTNKTAGLGLQNIMARADVLKARIFLTTGEGRGVDYLIQIPE